MANYLDTATVTTSKKFYMTNFRSYMIFTNADAYTCYGKVEKFTRGLNFHYIAFIGSLIYFLYTRVDLSFAVHTLAKFSSTPGKEHFEVISC